jgi:hypothetical protein
MKIFINLLKYTILSLLCVLALILLAIPISIYEMPNDLHTVDNTEDIVLDNANYIDVLTGKTIRNQRIYLSKGRIVSIGEKTSSQSRDARVIDLHGEYVVPGLFDMHVHLHDRKYLALYLAYGVTSVRNMRGLPMHLRWKSELNRGDWLGSNLYTSSPVLDGERYAHALQQVVISPAKARELVRKYKDDGYDFIKAYGYLDKEVFEAITDEASRLDFPIAKHGPNPIDGLGLQSNSGLQSLEHVEDIFQGPLNFSFDQNSMAIWVSQLKAINPTVTPTLATFHHLTKLSQDKAAFVDSLPLNTLNPLYRIINAEFGVKRWLGASQEQADWNSKEEQFLFDIVRELDKQEVTLLLGSDGGTLYMPPGLSTHLEIELMVKAGISPIKVLRAATINAATALGVDDKYGSIEIGKVADLVVLKENPLDDLQALAAPIAVIKAGQWINSSELSALRISAEKPSNLYISMGRLLEDIISRAMP